MIKEFIKERGKLDFQGLLNPQITFIGRYWLPTSRVKHNIHKHDHACHSSQHASSPKKELCEATQSKKGGVRDSLCQSIPQSEPKCTKQRPSRIEQLKDNLQQELSKGNHRKDQEARHLKKDDKPVLSMNFID
jgi:hypothetical protein